MKNANNLEEINNVLKNKNTKSTQSKNEKSELFSGFTITEEIEKLDILKTKVLKYIVYKKRTEKEIRQKFSDEDQNLLEDVIECFKEQGYIDDINYIERFVNEYIALKNLSIRELKYKLIGKGISKDDIEKYFSENLEKITEYEYKSAQNIVNKKIKKEDEENIKSYLYKKGYTSEAIKNAFED